MTEYVTAWQCVGCGKIDAPAPCVGICSDRRTELVYASDHRRLLAEAALAARKAEALAAIVRQLANTRPAAGQWERSYRALQERARHALAALASEAQEIAA
jgi:hypothetical protein